MWPWNIPLAFLFFNLVNMHVILIHCVKTPLSSCGNTIVYLQFMTVCISFLHAENFESRYGANKHTGVHSEVVFFSTSYMYTCI